MNADELRALIREVLKEQDDKVKIASKSMGSSAFGKAGKEDRLEANPELSNMERGIIQQIDQFLLNLAEMPGVDLQAKRTTLERVFNVLKKQITAGVKEQPQQTNEGHDESMIYGGIEDDDHEVHMAISDLHKLEKYAPQVAQLASEYSDLPGWVQSKITLAADYLGKVYHYLDGKHNKGIE